VKFDKEAIQRRALELVAAGGHRVGSQLATEFGVSRQVANGYLQALVKDGLIDAQGSTQARVYTLKTLTDVEHTFPREGLEEDVVWRERLAPLVVDLPQNVRDIWHYGFTEMTNNAIDHSGSPTVRVGLRRNALFTDGWIEDAGEGIFLKIQRALNLYDPRESILELAKGKLTTAPSHHTGEGIFFTSRMMDGFDIQSGRLHFRHSAHAVDRLTDDAADKPGTRVMMRLTNDSRRKMEDVFNDFSNPEDYSFDKTEVPLRLAQHEGEKLVSRSQAKRVAHRFERFNRVVLDFTGIEEIGQAFADEIFRVFAASHPNIRLIPANTSPSVANMIRRALSAGSASHGDQ
jgi:hypothetical protein